MDKRGSSHTKVEILLTLAENEDGIRKREDFLVSNARGGYEIKNRSRFLSERLNEKGSDGIGILEKSLSELARDGFIERTSIGEGIFFKRAYKLKFSGLYGLSRIFSLILEGEKVRSGNSWDYNRLERFIASPFFEKAWHDHILDVIYDFELWDEKKYPLKISKKDAREIKGYQGPKDSSRIPSFFRKYFTGKGPVLYENFLKSEGFTTTLLSSLNGEIPQYINLFTFLENQYSLGERRIDLGGKYEANMDPLRVALNTWFNNFWYGNLERETEIFGNAWFKNKVCRMGLGDLLSGKPSFINLETWDQQNSLLEHILFPIELWAIDRLQIVDK